MRVNALTDSIFFVCTGAGIADQDRNILTNQHLLLASFQSAASFLSAGSDPSPVAEDRKKISRSKKRKRQGADADDDRDEDADEPVSDLEEEVPQDYEEDEDVEKPAPTMNTSGTKEFRKSGLERLSRNALGNNGRRGSIFITLRDAKPYSLWYVLTRLMLVTLHVLTCLFLGMSHVSQNGPHRCHHHSVVMNANRDTPSSARLSLTLQCTWGMNTEERSGVLLA